MIANTPPPNGATDVSAYRWIVAFFAFGLIMFLVTKLKIGYTLVYYLAVLVLLLLILTQYQAIAGLLLPLNVTQGGKSG